MNAWWSSADSAEMDALVWELCRGYFEHRERCDACSSEPVCPIFTAWRKHVAECEACAGDAPLTHGLPCERYHQFIAHGDACRRCNSCHALRKAIEVVVEWREARMLLSRAEFLRAERCLKADFPYLRPPHGAPRRRPDVGGVGAKEPR